MTNLIATEREGVWLVESDRAPGHYYVVQEAGPFIATHVELECPADEDCKHTIAALEKTRARLREEPMETTTEDGIEVAGHTEEGAPVPATLAVAPIHRTMVEKANATREAVASDLAVWHDALELGGALVATGFFGKDVDTPQKGAFVVLKARALGIDPINAAEFLYVVDNKVKLMGQMIAALVARSGKGRIQIIESNAQRCVARGFRTGWDPITIEYTIEDLSRAQSGRKFENPSVKLHPADHLRWKAEARVGRVMFADVLSGMDMVTMADDGNAYDFDSASEPEHGRIIDSTARDVTNEPTPEPAPAEPEWKAELDALKREHGVSNDEIAGVLGERPTVKSVQAWLDGDDSRSIARLVSNALDRREPAEAVAPFI